MLRQYIVTFFFPLSFFVPIVVHAITFDDMLRQAHRNSATIRTANAQLAAQLELRPQAIAAFLPQISAQAVEGRSLIRQINPNTNGGTMDIPAGNLNETITNRSVQLNGTLNLFAGGQNIANLNLADTQIGVQRYQLTSTEQMILNQAAINYASIYYFDKQLEVLIEQTQQLHKLEAQMKNMHSRQNATITDVAQITNQIAQVELQYEMTLAQKQAAVAQLVAIIGAFDGDVSEQPPLFPVPKSMEQAIIEAEQTNPFLQQALFQLEGNRANVDIARGAMLPRVDLTTSALLEFDKSNFVSSTDFITHQRQDNYSIALQVTMPLYSGGLLSSQVRQNLNLVNAARYQVSDTFQQVVSTTKANWAQLNASRLQIESSQRQIDAASIALEGLMRQFRDGTLSTLDLLSAQQQNYQAQLSYFNAKLNEFSASANLAMTIGNISVG